VLSNPALSYTNRMLRAVVQRGTGTRAAVPGYDLAGKTGTTSDYKDAWFVGYTGGFTTAVWVGKDNNKPMGRVTGGSAPADIWRTFMTAALPRLAVRPIPEGPQALPTPMYEDPIGQLLETANEIFEGDQASFEELPAGELPMSSAPMPAPSTPAPAGPVGQPYPPQPYEAVPYRGQPPYAPAPQPAPPPSAGPRQPSLQDYVAAGATG
jgi:penicillin-binding protein 1A